MKTDAVEISPDGRYIRYNELLGSGAYKDVFKGFDLLEGIDIAWNQIAIFDRDDYQDVLLKTCSEAVMVQTLDHENIIKCYNYWVDENHKNVNMITELFSSGTLKQFRNQLDTNTIKDWGKQILQGLHYLHNRDYPIIHRDLKCDNIFLHEKTGKIKIGDFGLATTIQKNACAIEIVGTPAFMAPEYYDDEYNEAVDIYAFGMCMLEMVTGESPYRECQNGAQIFRKVTIGVRPLAFGKVNDPVVKELIDMCLAPDPSKRLSAVELLGHPFFNTCVEIQSDEDSIISDISSLYNTNNDDGISSIGSNSYMSHDWGSSISDLFFKADDVF